jgi:D-glycero-alpha-D-manno-heptose-7-phosphate kinase
MLLIGRAPVRITFAGDGTDLPIYYNRHGGLVISSTIAYYVYAILTAHPADVLKTMPDNHHLLYGCSPGETLLCNNNDHLPEAIAQLFNFQDEITIFMASQIPPGIGLGYSSSMTVATLKALALWCGLDLKPEAVADLACCIEYETGTPANKQDTYAAALGGLNAIAFSRSGVTVEPLNLPAGAQEALEERLILFFVRPSHQASPIPPQPNTGSQPDDAEILQKLEKINALSLEIREALESGDLDSFGQLLHRSWIESRHLTVEDSHPLDRYYWIARELGALGGKVSGTERGGVLLIYCSKKYQAAIINALEELGLQSYPFTVSKQGVQIMQPQPQSLSHLSLRQHESQAT